MKKKLITAIIAVILCLAMAGCAVVTEAKDKNEKSGAKDQGFKTPEKVMKNFVKQVSKGNFEQTVKGFAVNQMAGNYDFEAQIDSTKSWGMHFIMPYPSKGSYTDVNKELLRAYYMKQIANMCFSLSADEEMLKGENIILEDESSEEFASSFLLHDLDTFSMVKMKKSNPDVQSSENYKKTIERNNKIYGSDDYEEYVIYYKWNDEKYTGTASFIKYKNLWYLSGLNSPLAGADVSAYLEKQ